VGLGWVGTETSVGCDGTNSGYACSTKCGNDVPKYAPAFSIMYVSQIIFIYPKIIFVIVYVPKYAPTSSAPPQERDSERKREREGANVSQSEGGREGERERGRERDNQWQPSGSSWDSTHLDSADRIP
jgi:hypothetical protein